MVRAMHLRLGTGERAWPSREWSHPEREVLGMEAEGDTDEDAMEQVV